MQGRLAARLGFALLFGVCAPALAAGAALQAGAGAPAAAGTCRVLVHD